MKVFEGTSHQRTKGPRDPRTRRPKPKERGTKGPEDQGTKWESQKPPKLKIISKKDNTASKRAPQHFPSDYARQCFNSLSNSDESCCIIPISLVRSIVMLCQLNNLYTFNAQSVGSRGRYDSIIGMDIQMPKIHFNHFQHIYSDHSPHLG